MIKNFLDSDLPDPVEKKAARTREPEVLGIFGMEPELGAPQPTEPAIELPKEEEPAYERREPAEPPAPTILLPYEPPTAGESVRMAGLAWSVGITLFGSIVFMLVIGWLAAGWSGWLYEIVPGFAAAMLAIVGVSLATSVRRPGFDPG